MSRSTLQRTGRCHWCKEETKNLFCCDSCRDKYHVYKNRGWEVPANARRTGGPKAEFRFTAVRRTQKEIDAAIDRIVDRDTGGKPQWYLRQYTATLAPAA